MNLRVHDFDFEERMITVFGKGQKFRKAILPQSLMPKLHDYLERVKYSYDLDLQKEFYGAFMPDIVDLKHKNSARELGWQFFPPAKQLTPLADGEIGPNGKISSRFRIVSLRQPPFLHCIPR